MEIEQTSKLTIEETYTFFGIEYEDAFNRLKTDVPNFRNINWDLSEESGILVVTFHLNDKRHFNKLIKEFKKVFGDKILTNQNKTLEETFFAEVLSNNAKVSTAESITGGMIASRIIDVPGSSSIIDASFVVYSENAKISFLGVSDETLSMHGVVSVETAIEMAKKLQEKTGSEIAISSTGIAGPSKGNSKEPVGTVCFGFRLWDQSYFIKKIFKGDRTMIRKKASAFALAFTIVLLRKLARDEKTIK